MARHFLTGEELTAAEQSRLLDRAIKLDPSSADAHYWLGMVHEDARRTGKAREEFEEALRKRPNYAQAWYDLGEVSRKLKDKKGAERAFRKYLELAPDGTFASDVREYLR